MKSRAAQLGLTTTAKGCRRSTETYVADWCSIKPSARKAESTAERQATRFRTHLRETKALSLLELRDDGFGLPSPADRRHGFGLQGMRDRILTLSSAMSTMSDAHGARLHVLLRQAA
ncbi:MAG TPA: hypothetical protein VLK26_11280 [Rudaea sp.]|nr:hypothetical protein [Rudaea sp.]